MTNKLYHYVTKYFVCNSEPHQDKLNIFLCLRMRDIYSESRQNLKLNNRNSQR